MLASALLAGSASLPATSSIRTRQLWPRSSGSVVLARAAGQGPARSFDSPASTSAASTSATPTLQPLPSTSSTGGSAGAAAAAAAARPSYRVSPWQAMAFAGPVPERVNGRLAMLAILYIARQEMLTGQTGGFRAWGMTCGAVLCRRYSRLAWPASSRALFAPLTAPHPSPRPAVLEQAAALPTHYGAWPLLALMALLVYAAFPPALAGAREEDFGFMSVAAEKTNGRAAMLGLAALLALEWHSGLCFF